jgi:cytidylate kinase
VGRQGEEDGRVWLKTSIAQIAPYVKVRFMSEPTRKIVIAVDGPAASGKGTFAKALAARLGYAYLDTGTLYRIVALAALQKSADPANPEAVKPLLDTVKFPLPAERLTSADLRSPQVDEAVSQVALIPEVRAAVRAYQTAFMKNPPGNAAGVVLDGRDIGTVICPDADIKFFVTASAEERARRRFEEQKASNPGLTPEMVLKDINARDERDRDRPLSPLRAAADAYVLDTTTLNPAETLEKGLGIIAAKRKKKFLNPARPPSL